MTKKNNQSKKSGQLARSSQNNNQRNKNSSLGQPSLAAPVAYSSPTLNQAPKIKSSARMTAVSHRELVATISGNTTFGTQDFSLNPGLAATFPWLSSIAPSFEQYCFKRLRFHYVTRCATSYVGSVLLAPEYDALDSAPTSEVLTAMMAGAKEDVPWRDQVIDFNVRDMFPLGPRKFIRTSALSGSADLKTYDAGQLFVGKAGCADTSNIGKLWVEYDVELHIPQNPNASTSVSVGAALAYNVGGTQAIADGVKELVVYDEEVYNSLGASVTGGVVTLPIGDYMFFADVVANSSASGTGATSLIVNALKDGVAMVPACGQAIYEDMADTATFTCAVNVFGYISSDGTNTLSLDVTMACAGTLTLPADNSRLIVIRVF
jgi:hypothetical protein